MAYLYGDTAAITLPTGGTMKANSWGINVTQSVAEAVSFGETWVSSHGCVKRYSGSVGGFAAAGGASSGLVLVIPASASTVFTLKTGNTLTGTVVFSAMGINAALESASGMSYSFTGDSTLTETWA